LDRRPEGIPDRANSADPIETRISWCTGAGGKDITMGASRTSFEKLQRDRAKKAKAAAKREKRLDKSDPIEGTEEAIADPSTLAPGQEIPPDTLLRMVAELHEQFESEKISFEEFEDRKTELFALLSVD
jgi:hypothetical protein